MLKRRTPRRLWNEDPRWKVRPLAIVRPHLAGDIARAEAAARQVVDQVLLCRPAGARSETVAMSPAAMDRLLDDVRGDECPPRGIPRPIHISRGGC